MTSGAGAGSTPTPTAKSEPARSRKARAAATVAFTPGVRGNASNLKPPAPLVAAGWACRAAGVRLFAPFAPEGGVHGVAAFNHSVTDCRAFGTSTTLTTELLPPSPVDGGGGSS